MSTIEKQKMEACAHKIRTFWGKLGYSVDVWIEPIAGNGGSKIGNKEEPIAWQIKSNMKGGCFPKGFSPTEGNLRIVHKAINNFFL